MAVTVTPSGQTVVDVDELVRSEAAQKVYKQAREVFRLQIQKKETPGTEPQPEGGVVRDRSSRP